MIYIEMEANIKLANKVINGGRMKEYEKENAFIKWHDDLAESINDEYLSLSLADIAYCAWQHQQTIIDKLKIAIKTRDEELSALRGFAQYIYKNGCADYMSNGIPIKVFPRIDVFKQYGLIDENCCPTQLLSEDPKLTGEE